MRLEVRTSTSHSNYLERDYSGPVNVSWETEEWPKAQCREKESRILLLRDIDLSSG